MRHKFAGTGLALVVSAGILVSIAINAYADDEGKCTVARAAGKWSLTDQGTVIGIGPRTAVGVFTLDGSGNVLNGVAASSLNGSIASETYSGTYTVNPDCSGSLDVKIYSGSTELFEVKTFTAFDNDIREMRAVFTSVVPPNGPPLPTVINFEARRQ